MQKFREIVLHYSKKSLPKQVTIVEMGPRDGLQNEKEIIPTDTKVEFINKLSDCGYKRIEVTSFVSAKWVPQMGDNSELYQRIQKRPGVVYSALIPNMKGYEVAKTVGVSEIAVFTSVSETFNQKNINCSIEDSFNRFRPIMRQAYMDSIKVRGYISCAMGCPYEGDIDPQSVRDLAYKLKEIGCYEISLGDTIGVGTMKKTRELIEAVLMDLSPDEIAVHFHNTYGRAIENILTAMEYGIHIIDSSVASLGGCPYAEGATGNVSTEDVLFVLHQLGIDTGISLPKVCQTANWISETGNIINRSIYQEH